MNCTPVEDVLVEEDETSTVTDEAKWPAVEESDDVAGAEQTIDVDSLPGMDVAEVVTVEGNSVQVHRHDMVSAVNDEPVMVTRVPPVVGPSVGEMDATDGDVV